MTPQEISLALAPNNISDFLNMFSLTGNVPAYHKDHKFTTMTIIRPSKNGEEPIIGILGKLPKEEGSLGFSSYRMDESIYFPVGLQEAFNLHIAFCKNNL